MKKGKWSKEEDNLIKNHIEKYGIGFCWWIAGLRRCGRSCRSRWLNYLRPGLKHGNFTPAEDKIICEMYRKKGSCWSVIAAELPGRTDLAIKNYWNSTLKKRFPRPRAARSRRRRRRTGGTSTSSDATSLDLALVVYDEESTSGTARDLPLVVCNEENSATTARDLPLVAYNVNEASATAGSSSSHAGVVSAGSPVQARAQPTPLPADAANEEPIAAVPVSGPVKMEPRTPPPPADETSEEMDVGCCPMSPLPLGLMELPELPCIALDLPHIAGFDDIDSLLSYFDH
ncbi:myb-related protein 308-like [Triticum dicoccoides]|uniref:myb-related protein 308-like n=1 Tax=Triticum dicoccoides TaxID=85692 RepID=UPI001890AFEB|nr:myb-related protein 308-like [Triticum dicoccoides]